MNRTRIALAAALSCILYSTSYILAAKPPNIILCMGDDHGWEETGYNGHPYLLTPVLDEMAATGLRLDHFYSGHPSCSPTRGSFLTGRHPNRYGTFTPGCSIRHTTSGGTSPGSASHTTTATSARTASRTNGRRLRSGIDRAV